MLYLERGWKDLLEGAQQWRTWHLMGSGELRRRYARSRLGQFWLTLSMGISIAIMGFVWSILWKMSLADMLPHLAVSIVVWQFLAGIISDSSSMFVSSRHLLLSHRMPCSVLVFAMLYRNLLTLLHNAVILAVVFVLFWQPIGLQALLLLPALMLSSITAFWLGYVTGAFCARFRDLSHAVTSMLQLAFFITPVIWKPDFLTEQYRWLLLINPFSIYMSIIRDPLMGEPFSPINWLLAIAIAVIGFVLALIFIGKYHRRLIFWI